MTSLPANTSKPSAPTKKSIFERQREEAEAKKARDEVETAAVYEDFVKSFEQDEGPSTPAERARHTAGGYSSGPGTGKRHFTTSGLKSGPGTLGPSPSIPKSGPGSLGPAFGKKRHIEDHSYREPDRAALRESGKYRDTSAAHDDGIGAEEDEKAARPTLHLSALPPSTSPAVINALFSTSPLTIEGVRILPGSTSDRKALSAIVTLAAETSSTDIDTVVSHLQNKYLGYGFNLSISRHLSSAALVGTGGLTAPTTNLTSLPFGAQQVHQESSLSRAPPPGRGRGYAPPSSYTSSTPYSARPQSQVVVKPPSDLKQLKMIHKTLESLLTYGPEFEALLMARPQVQREERWAWLWNPRSQGGIYYRWRLWQVLTDSQTRHQLRSYGARPPGDVLFEGQSLWLPPEAQLDFEYTTALHEFVSDDDYNSSDEEGEGEDGGISRRHNDHNAPTSIQDLNDPNDGLGHLNPLSKAKLMHLLTRLPDANTKLRKGDVARITGFAIEHAGAGADEVATLVTRNVVQPFNQYRTEDEDERGDPVKQSLDEDASRKDSSTSSMVGLYIISDILSSSASAGVRHAWRYRQLFENTLRQQRVFEKLGRLDRDLDWGKLKAEKWKRSVQTLLQLWEGWCIFPQTSHDEMVEHFLNPPLSSEEQKKLAQEEKRRAEDEATRRKAGNKWRSVEADAEDTAMPDAGVDGEEMDDDEDGDAEDMDVDVTTLIDEAVDGVAMADSSDEEMTDDVPELPRDSTLPPPPPPPPPLSSPPRTMAGPTTIKGVKAPPTSVGRQRPKALDMFANDSD